MPTKNIDEYVKQKLEAAAKEQANLEEAMLQGLILAEQEKLQMNATLNIKYQNADHAAWVAKKFHKYGTPETSKQFDSFKVDWSITPTKPAKVADKVDVKEGSMFEVLPLAKEFYVVEALVLLYQEKEVTKRQYKALIGYRTKLHESMRYLFRDYILLSCFGEARHGGSSSKLYIPECTESNLTVRGRYEAGKLAQQFSVETIHKQIYKLFDEGEWTSGYGGEKWAKAIKAMDLYHRPAVFLDHVFDLKHNGSSLFNKTDYEILSIESVDKLKSYLNKRLVASPEELLEMYLSGLVAEQCLPLIKVVNPTKKRLTYSLESLLNYQPLVFGTRILSAPQKPPGMLGGCKGCGWSFFKVSEHEEYCYNCLAKSSFKNHIQDCFYCQKAYEYYYPDAPLVFESKPVVVEPKVEPKEQIKHVKDEQRHKKSFSEQKQIELPNLATLDSDGGKSVGDSKQSKPKIKWKDGSTDWSDLITINLKKPNPGTAVS